MEITDRDDSNPQIDGDVVSVRIGLIIVPDNFYSKVGGPRPQISSRYVRPSVAGTEGSFLSLVVPSPFGGPTVIRRITVCSMDLLSRDRH